MAIEHVASANGSAMRFAIRNRRLLLMLLLLPATSIFLGYVSMPGYCLQSDVFVSGEWRQVRFDFHRA
jgi:hypothetical protein